MFLCPKDQVNVSALPAAQANDGSRVDSLQATLDAMRRVLARKFGIDDADLSVDRELASLGLDSLAFIEYAFELESELGISLPDLPREMVTVGDLAKFIHAEVARTESLAASR